LDEIEAVGEEPAASRFTAFLPSGNHGRTGRVRMRFMRKLLVLAVVCSLVFATGAAARIVVPGKPPPFPGLPGDWSHAEINVKVKRVPHTLILDRGRVVQLSPTQLKLREADGSAVVIPLAPSTIVTFRRPGRRPNAFLRRGFYVETMVIDAGPAVRVLVLRRR
jgi:hypothetical protein